MNELINTFFINDDTCIHYCSICHIVEVCKGICGFNSDVGAHNKCIFNSVPLLSDRFKSNPVAVGVVEKTKRSEENE